MQLDGAGEYEYHPPTQEPINPPYKHACKLKSESKLPQEATPSTSSADAIEHKSELSNRDKVYQNTEKTNLLQTDSEESHGMEKTDGNSAVSHGHTLSLTEVEQELSENLDALTVDDSTSNLES